MRVHPLAQMPQGFALLELPIVLSVVSIVGLLVVLALHLSGARVTWVTWVVGGTILPGAGLAIGAIGIWIEWFNDRQPKEPQ